MAYQRVVVKLGTSVLTAGTDRLSRPRMVDLVRQMADLFAEGREVILVSSGAIMAGREVLGFPEMDRNIPFKQVLAAVGQGRLMHLYAQMFDLYDIIVAQALLTRRDLALRSHYLNARNTLMTLLRQRVIPVVNENDTVAVEEIKIGDNDNLSALVANLVDADLLIILTDTAGLFTADPRLNPDAQLIPEVPVIDDAIRDLAGSATTGRGVGGMITKIEAAELATRSGTEVVIAAGKVGNVVSRVAAGEAIGTRFRATAGRVESRKRWILAESPRGTVVVDAGAARALIQNGKSLLPVGVTAVEGQFERGETVQIADPQGMEIGRGITNYGVDSLARIRGLRSDQIEKVLGYDYGAEVIHRDNLVVVQG
ncbi:MAG: glutamate 5-kinase [Anaerolineae bacterium]